MFLESRPRPLGVNNSTQAIPFLRDMLYFGTEIRLRRGQRRLCIV
jgi:hypothetical protein